MNFVYCQACGSKVEYLLKTPAFCSACGVSTGGTQKGSSPLAKHQNKEMKVSSAELDDPDGTDVNHVPRLQGLQYEVDGDYRAIGRSHGSLGNMLNAAAAQGELPDLPEIKTSSPSPPTEITSEPTAPQQLSAAEQSIQDCKSSATR